MPLLLRGKLRESTARGSYPDRERTFHSRAGLVKDSAIIAPDSARDTVLARTRPELFRTARWVSEESGHERKAASTTPSRSAG